MGGAGVPRGGADGLVEAGMMALAPGRGEALKLMRLVKVGELAISGVLTNEALLASVVMATARPAAALVRVGAVVSRVALSVTGASVAGLLAGSA